MTFTEFKSSLKGSHPPETASILLQALWYDCKGNWEKAHELAQDVETPEGALIHAYLHRKEGDTGNAMYWYHRAHSSMPDVTLEQEWDQLVKRFLL
jgi:hypothetical protein